MPALGFGRDKEKFCQLFQKLRVVGRSPTVYQGCGGEATAFPYFQKRGTDVPLLGQHKSRCPRAWNKKVVKYFKKLGNMRVLFYTRVVKYLARW